MNRGWSQSCLFSSRKLVTYFKGKNYLEGWWNSDAVVVEKKKNPGIIIQIVNICHLGSLPISLHHLHLILHMITLSVDSIYSKLGNHSPLKNQLNIFTSSKCIFFLETGLSLPQKALTDISESQNWLWIIDMHFIAKI